jgi:flagellar FliL protein
LKANPKMKADAKADASAAPASNKKLIIMIAVAALVVGIGAGAAWFFLKGDAHPEKAHKTVKAALPPEYVPVEQFVVNLQPENGEQYLQVQFTLQVNGPAQVELVKANMAKVRNRVLMLLSAKRASEISTVEGKQALAAEIVAALNAPFADKGEAQEVTEVLFTAFIIQ